MSNNQIRLLTEKEVLMTIRNEALANKINSLVSIDVIKGAKAINKEHKKQLADNLKKYEDSLKRFTDLLKILDKRIANIKE